MEVFRLKPDFSKFGKTVYFRRLCRKPESDNQCNARIASVPLDRIVIPYYSVFGTRFGSRFLAQEIWGDTAVLNLLSTVRTISSAVLYRKI